MTARPTRLVLVQAIRQCPEGFHVLSYSPCGPRIAVVRGPTFGLLRPPLVVGKEVIRRGDISLVDFAGVNVWCRVAREC